MKASELMTPQPACCTPEDTIRLASQLMREHDCGCIPVVEDKESNRLAGVVTDRDIACRCTAEGKGPETKVKEAMTRDPKCCQGDDDVAVAENIMAEAQVRRVPVVDSKGLLRRHDRPGGPCHQYPGRDRQRSRQGGGADLGAGSCRRLDHARSGLVEESP